MKLYFQVMRGLLAIVLVLIVSIFSKGQAKQDAVIEYDEDHKLVSVAKMLESNSYSECKRKVYSGTIEQVSYRDPNGLYISSFRLNGGLSSHKIIIDSKGYGSLSTAETKLNTLLSKGNKIKVTAYACGSKDEWTADSIQAESSKPEQAKSEDNTQSNALATKAPIELVNTSFTVGAGQLYTVPFTLSSFKSVVGRFDVSGNRWSDIRVFLVATWEYDNLRNNRPFRAFYTSGQVVSGSINALLPAGSYLLVFSNAHSAVASATVRAFLSTAN